MNSHDSLGVMQPYFLPYLNYFALIRKAGAFVLYDDVQYVKQSWINRNRVRASNEQGWKYLTIPIVKAPWSATIREIRVEAGSSWRTHIQRMLRSTYGKAAHFDAIMPLLEPIWSRCEWLFDLNETLLQAFAGYLGLDTRWYRSSALGERLEANAGDPAPDPRTRALLRLCKQMGAREYWNLPGGRDLYEPEPFQKEGIRLQFLPPLPLTRIQAIFPQASDLSILDLAMLHAPDQIRHMLDLCTEPG